MKPLNRHTASLPDEHKFKVLQFGEGNFLRGFVNWMLELINENSSFNAGVVVVQPIERGMAQQLQEQDGLYHVVLEGIQSGKTVRDLRLIKCIKSALNPYADYGQFLSLGESPELEFVISNTTEAGIFFEGKDRDMSQLPSSFPGKLTALLHHRFRHFKGSPDKALSILPCELIEGNGQALREAILQYINHWDLGPEFKDWIVQHTIFCNTLVDRIVPGYPSDTIRELQHEIGYEDKMMVKAEPFHLWVIEGPETLQDKFPTHKAKLSVKFVKDLSPYRSRKVRILNGAHTALVPVAYLKGIRTVGQAIEDPAMRSFIREAIFEEIIPTLELPRAELEQFAEEVLERFQNPFIRHELISISLNSLSKYKVRVLPSVLGYYRKKQELPRRLVQALAALMVFYRGVWRGETIPLHDSPEVLAFFRRSWAQDDAESLVRQVLGNTDFWERDLNELDGLSQMLLEEVNSLLQCE